MEAPPKGLRLRFENHDQGSVIFIGHYAVALAAKKIAPRTSLGTLVAAAVFLDLVWPILVIAGVERFAIDPAATAFTPLDFVSYPWSHSLLMSVVWGVVFGAAYYAIRNYPRGAAVTGVLVVSHWILDALVHRPDLALTPWGDVRIGLGVWNNVPATLAIELALLAGGTLIYVTGTRSHDHVGSWGFIFFLLLLVLVFAAVSFGPPPPDTATVAWSAQAQWLFVALAAWVDAHRSSAR